MARSVISGRIASTRKNNLVPNGGFEIRPSSFTAATTGTPRWVDGTAAGGTAKLAYGWANIAVTSAAESAFDTSVFRSGSASMRLSTTNSAGLITVASFRINSPTAASVYEMFPIRPSTNYLLTAYIRTTNVAASGAYVECRTYNSTFGGSTTHTSTKLSGTDAGWRQVAVLFTSASTAAWGGIFLRNNVAGNVSDAWFDDIVLAPILNSRVTASGRGAI